MKQIFKPDNHELEKAFQTIEDRFEFIWGITSTQSLDIEASLCTLNDIDIIFDRYDNLYLLELETTYLFKTKKEECEYLVKLLDKFTKWMEDQEISRNEKLAIWDGISFTSRTIENLYTQFLCYVNGYCALYGNDESSPEAGGYMGEFIGMPIYDQEEEE